MLSPWLATDEGSLGSDLREEESQPEVVWIDSYDVFASAGNGVHNDCEHLEARVPVPGLNLMVCRASACSPI